MKRKLLDRVVLRFAGGALAAAMALAVPGTVPAQSQGAITPNYKDADIGQVIEAVNLFRAKVVDVSTESLTVEATGTPEKLEALLRVLEPYGIRELVQSGVVSLSRGPRGIGSVK